MRGLFCLALLGAISTAALADPPFPLANDPRIDPSKFRVTTFASGLAFPTAMQTLPDGSMLVAENDGTNFYSSSGRLVRFTDVDHDGVADIAAGTTLNTGL